MRQTVIALLALSTVVLGFYQSNLIHQVNVPGLPFNPVFSSPLRRHLTFQSSLSAMKITVRIVGKQKKGGDDKWLQDAYDMYSKRLKPAGIDLETSWVKDNAELVRQVKADKGKVVLLDPEGDMMTSERLADDLYKWLSDGGSRLSFVIGDASEGIPQDLKQSRHPMISLSRLTFTHQFARTIISEQCYRASEIRKGSGYHK